jgi:hypothetical protein
MLAVIIGITIVVLVSGIAVAGFLVFDRLIPAATRRGHNEVTGYTYSFVGPLYAILLAFVVVAVWEYSDAARLASSDEAAALLKVDDNALGLGPAYAAQVQQLATKYGQSVIFDEWPTLAKGYQGSPKTEAAYRALVTYVEAYSPADERTGVLYSAEISSLDEMAVARTQRLIRAENGLHPGLWVALYVGAVISTGFVYLFGAKNRISHAVMVGLLAASTAGMIYLIWLMNGPFQGPLRVLPTAMEDVLTAIQSNQPLGNVDRQ